MTGGDEPLAELGEQPELRSERGNGSAQQRGGRLGGIRHDRQA